MKAEAVTFRRGLVSLVLIGLLLDFFAATGLKAATWSGSNAGDLLIGSSWDSGTAPNGTDAVATISTLPTNPGNFSLNSSMTLGKLEYSNSQSRFIKGPGPLNLAVSSGTPEISVTGGNLTILPTISGSSGLSKTGSAMLTLGNSNTYTGSTTVTAGTLTAVNTTGSATGSGDITVNAGATLAIGNGVSTGGAVSGNIVDNGTVRFNRPNAIPYSGQISGTGSLTTIAGTITLSGNNSYSGGACGRFQH